MQTGNLFRSGVKKHKLFHFSVQSKNKSKIKQL